MVRSVSRGRRIAAVAGALVTIGAAIALGVDAPVGTLDQLKRTDGCFVDPTMYAPLQSCADARGLGSTQNLVISPDGRNLYAVSNFTWGLAVFRRDARTGRLTQLAGRAGCWTSQELGGCAAGRGMVWAFWVAVSPDGRDVYVSGGLGYAIAHLRRNTRDGRLSQPSGASACVRNRTGGTSHGGGSAEWSGCQLVDGLLYPRTVTLSPDGRFLYAAAFDADSVLAFARDIRSGDISPVLGGCSSSRQMPECGPAAQLDGATDVVVTHDGRFLYAAAFRAGAVDAFARDPQSGALTQLAAPGGCVAAAAQIGCTAVRGLRGAYGLALSPDDRSLYVASRNSAAVAVFDRDLATGALRQKPGTRGCLSSTGREGCASARGLRGTRGVSVSPDGRSVYTGAYSDSAIAVFARDEHGDLRQLRGQAGCVASGPGLRSCTRGRATLHAWGITISRDGRFLYSGVGGDNNSGLAIFMRRQ
jgi:6-phosphogluconolactonase (cycloisomerase 2 family)